MTNPICRHRAINHWQNDAVKCGVTEQNMEAKRRIKRPRKSKKKNNDKTISQATPAKRSWPTCHSDHVIQVDPQPETQGDHIRTRKRTPTHTHTHRHAPHTFDKGVETCDFVIDTKKPLIGTLTLLMLWQISPKDPRRRAAARVDMRPCSAWVHTHTHTLREISGQHVPVLVQLNLMPLFAKCRRKVCGLYFDLCVVIGYD